MSEFPLSVLLVGTGVDVGAGAPPQRESPHGPFEVTRAASFASAGTFDAVVCTALTAEDLQALLSHDGLAQAAFDAAFVVLAGERDAATERALIERGVQDVVEAADSEAVARALRHAVLRKRLEQAARTTYATDLATGLPHQLQLLEHMTQLLALRERDPAPMVLIVLRIHALVGPAALAGSEASNILRRKVAVRLRAALRASDVVAAIGPDSFAVLLGHIEAASHGERVAAKLQRSLQQPFQVAGQACSVGAAIGMAHYPEDGKDARSLLQRAGAQAASVASLGREGFASSIERGERGGTSAANDEPA